MKSINKRQLATLQRAYQILAMMDAELYEELLSEGCQPNTCAHSLAEILRALHAINHKLSVQL